MPETKDLSVNTWGMSRLLGWPGPWAGFCILREELMTYFGAVCNFAQGCSRWLLMGLGKSVLG